MNKPLGESITAQFLNGENFASAIAANNMRELLGRKPTPDDLRVAGAHFPRWTDANKHRHQEAIFEMSSNLSFRFVDVHDDVVRRAMQVSLQKVFDTFLAVGKPVEIWMANPDGSDIWRAVGA